MFVCCAYEIYLFQHSTHHTSYTYKYICMCVMLYVRCTYIRYKKGNDHAFNWLTVHILYILVQVEYVYTIEAYNIRSSSEAKDNVTKSFFFSEEKTKHCIRTYWSCSSCLYTHIFTGQTLFVSIVQIRSKSACSCAFACVTSLEKSKFFLRFSYYYFFFFWCQPNRKGMCHIVCAVVAHFIILKAENITFNNDDDDDLSHVEQKNLLIIIFFFDILYVLRTKEIYLHKRDIISVVRSICTL